MKEQTQRFWDSLPLEHRRRLMADAQNYSCTGWGAGTVNNPELYKAFCEGQKSGLRLAKDHPEILREVTP